MGEEDVQNALRLLQLAYVIGSDIVEGVRSLLLNKYGEDYAAVEALWRENIARSAKDMG